MSKRRVTSEELSKIVGARVKAAREGAGLSRQQLCEPRLPSAVRLYTIEELGSSMSLAEMCAVAWKLGKSVDDFVGDLEIIVEK